MNAGSTKFFFAITASPYVSDTVCTVLRLVEAALAQGHQVVVWACWGATYLTMDTLTERKPRNFLRVGSDYPSTSLLIQALLGRYADRLQWFVCRHCMEERGATHQIKQVKVKPPLRYLQYHQQADVRLMIGSR
jgi:sulfur relay (sulfurtransferase) complex TusBCD TusD component (DsrE family)